MSRFAASIVIAVTLTVASGAVVWRGAPPGKAAPATPSATSTVIPAETPLPGGALRLRVVNDLNGNGMADPDEPGISGWHIEVGCGDGLTDLITDGDGYFVDVSAGSDSIDALRCYRAQRPFGWLPTGNVLTNRIPTAAYRAHPFPLTFKDLGRNVMEFSGELIFNGLPPQQAIPSVAKPFLKCGHAYQISYAPSRVEEAVIVEGSGTLAGCPSTGDLIGPGDGGQPAGRTFPFVPGTSERADFLLGAESMRFYATGVSRGSVLDVASGRVTEKCTVVIPLQGFVPEGSVRVFVLADAVRPGCGAPGRLVQLYRDDRALSPTFEWQAGTNGVGELTLAPPPVVHPPDTGSAGLLPGARAD